MTPNAMERRRLNDLFEKGYLHGDNIVVVEKGAHDVIRYRTNDSNDEQSITCGETGGLKRSGGLGDLLAGSLGTFVAWNTILSQQRSRSNLEYLPIGCWAACCLVKQATRQAFEEHRRAMTAPDVLSKLGPTMDEMTLPMTTESSSKL